MPNEGARQKRQGAATEKAQFLVLALQVSLGVSTLTANSMLGC